MSINLVLEVLVESLPSEGHEISLQRGILHYSEMTFRKQQPEPINAYREFPSQTCFGQISSQTRQHFVSFGNKFPNACELRVHSSYYSSIEFRCLSTLAMLLRSVC